MSNLSDLITATSAQRIMVQTLKNAGFEGDLTEGSPIYQLLIDPNAIIYAANVAKQDELKNSWSLLSGQADTSKALSTKATSNIFNNLRLLPTTGTKAEGKLTLVFTTNVTRSLAGASFIAADGALFSPKLAYILVPSEAGRSNYTEAELVYTSDALGYSVEIEVEAANIGSFSVGAGDTFTTTLTGLVSAHASNSFSTGRVTGSPSDLIRDIPEILSETSMMSPISISAALTKEFPQLNEIVIFRSGDAELQRSKKNLLGVDSGSADVVVTTSGKPSVTRTFIPGYLELAVDDNGILWNSTHKLGYAYRQPTAADPEEGVQADEIINGYVHIEVQLTDKTFTGATSIIASGLKTGSVLKNTTASADTEIQDNLVILSRGLVQDNKYGPLPVAGSDPKDFFFSAYQNRLKFEFQTDWLEVETVAEGVYEQAYTWIKYWSTYYHNETKGGSLFNTQLEALADAFGKLTPSQMPTTFRPEVPVYADVVYYESLAEIQTFINDDSRRCFGQDYYL